MLAEWLMLPESFGLSCKRTKIWRNLLQYSMQHLAFDFLEILNILLMVCLWTGS